MELFIDELFLGIETRGTDASGFLAVTNDGSTLLDKTNVCASKYITDRKKLPEGTRSVLMHTRLATQGHPSNNLNNHPVHYTTIFTTHNGHIRNDDEVFKELGVKRFAEVDSEAIPAAIYTKGFDNPKEAFALLDGGFATASVDVMQPGKVMLAKGPSYPLVVHENKKFILWASTKDIIETAWKNALGDPLPDKDTFRWLSDGDVMLLDKDKVTLTKNAFESKRSYTYAHHRQWNGWDDDDYSYYFDDRRGVIGRTNNSSTSRRTPGSVVTPASFNAIRKLRAEGKGEATVWLDREQMSDTKKKMHNGRWHYCNGCRETVMDIDTFDSNLYGKVCIDCYGWAVQRKNELDSAKVLSKSEVDSVEEWVKIESNMHINALIATAEEFGLSTDAVEYYLFRVSEAYLGKNARQRQIAEMLREFYKEAEADAWDDYVDSFEDDDDDDAEVITVSPCNVCNHLSVEKEINCPSCKFRKDGRTNKDMTFTRKRGHDESFKTRKCLTCNRKARIFLGLKHQWCGKHYESCQGNEHCKDDTVATGPDGQRYCHKHYRGMKGGIQDGDRYRSPLATTK